MSIRNYHSFLISAALVAVFFISLLMPSHALSHPHGKPRETHTIHVELDFVARRIEGTNTITIAGALPAKLSLVMSTDIDVDSLTVQGDKKDLLYSVRGLTSDDQESGLRELIIDLNGYQGPITVSFVVFVSPIETARQRIERGISFSGIAVMGREGAFLASSS